MWTWKLDLVGKISIFSLFALKPCGLATAWKSIQLLFYLWQQYLVKPLGFPKHSQTHSYSLFPHGQAQYDLGMGSQGSEMWGNILAVTVEIRASVQTWSSDILESRQLMIDAWKHFFFFLPFIHWRNIDFTTFCLLRVTDCLEILAWRSFLSTNFPSPVFP